MSNGIAAPPVPTKKAFDARFIQTSESVGGRETVTVRTSRFIYLHQAELSSLANAFFIPSGKDLTFYGDVVRVIGEIKVPGRNIKIVCRRLEFDYDSARGDGEKAPKIDVSGAKGKDGDAVKEPDESRADDGVEDWDYVEDQEHRDKSGYRRRAGKPGASREAGDSGKNGGDGGEIHIYCNTLVRSAPVELCANGGDGGNGRAGHKGQRGGNGWDKFYLSKADKVGLNPDLHRQLMACKSSKGGQGGNGGNGGNGGDGGNGGTIELCCLKLEKSDQLLTLRASVGNGGEGGQGGEGGRGGDGGGPAENESIGAWGVTSGGRTLDSWGAPGSDSGGGGAYGIPGYGGNGGKKPAKITLKSPNAGDWLAALPNLLLICEAGRPGRAGGDLADKRGRPIYKYAEPGTPGTYRSWGSTPLFESAKPHPGLPGKPNDKKPWPWVPATIAPRTWTKWGGFKTQPPPEPPVPQPPDGRMPKEWIEWIAEIHEGMANWEKAVCPECWQQATHKDIAAHSDTDQLEMVFDHLRTRCLLTDMSTPSESIGEITKELQLLVSLAEAKKENPAILKLRESAAATLQNAVLGCNVFGKDARYAAFGSLEKYQNDFRDMLVSFRNVEKTYAQLQNDLSVESTRQTYLTSVLAYQRALKSELEQRQKDLIDAVNDTSEAIDTLEASRSRLETDLNDLFQNFEKQVDEKTGLSVQSFTNLMTQLSFTNVEEGGLGVRGWLMVGSQIGEIASKAIEDVPTDTGTSINKKYVIRRMQSLGKDVKTFAGLKKKHGELQVDSSAEYRLLATRDQVNSICSNFYSIFDEARKITNTIDEYIEAVTTRNAKVEEYNQLSSGLRYISAELYKVGTEITTASDSNSKGSNPGLPAMARFSTALYRHALERCLEHLYIACRVFTMESLSLYDVFSQVLGKLAASATTDGELNSAALDTGFIDLISQKLRHEQDLQSNIQHFKPKGNQCWVRLVEEDAPSKGAFQIVDPVLFALLRHHQAATFQLLPPDAEIGTKEHPFAQKANVRLRKIRCRAKGMRTSDKIHRIDITHPGIETFVTEHGEQVNLLHTPFTHTSEFDKSNDKFTRGGALREERWMLGPFCEWIIEIKKESNEDLDLTKLHSIEIEFEGTYQPLKKSPAKPPEESTATR